MEEGIGVFCYYGRYNKGERKSMATTRGHGDREGRHYYITYYAFYTFSCIVVATLVVAMRSIAAFNLEVRRAR